MAAAVFGWTALAACGNRSEEYRTAVDTLTRGQKDTLIANMPVPGAGAVGRALEAAELAGARARELEANR